MSQHLPFGHPDRHYAMAPQLLKGQRDGKDHQLEEAMIGRLLGRYSEDVRQTVERTYRQWNPTVRDRLRTETAFSLNLGDDRQTVPVKVVDGLPLPFALVVRKHPDPIVWLLALNRSKLDVTASGIRLLVDNYEDIVRSRSFRTTPPPKEALNREWDFISGILGELKRLKLDDTLRQIDEDLLGAYFFRKPEVCLYWMPIGVVASMLNVSVEALTIVVLAHELAHAYTHLGHDIDGGRWDTPIFAKTDMEVAEGLAQFYTRAVCAGLAEKQPEAMTAYQKLMDMQSLPYRVHEQWVRGGEAVGEVVRLSMLNCRRKSVFRYDTFLGELEEARRLVVCGQTAM